MLREASVGHHERENISNGRTDNLNCEYCCCEKSDGSKEGPNAHFNRCLFPFRLDPIYMSVLYRWLVLRGAQCACRHVRSPMMAGHMISRLVTVNGLIGTLGRQ